MVEVQLASVPDVQYLYLVNVPSPLSPASITNGGTGVETVLSQVTPA